MSSRIRRKCISPMSTCEKYAYFEHENFLRTLYYMFDWWLPAPVIQNPCHPSPCGPNSQCREINGQAVCSCVPNYIGSPPTCRPECTVNSDCPFTEACSNQKCRDPCIGACGIGAKCIVVSHSPICSCPNRYSGNPFVMCQPISMSKLGSKLKSLRFRSIRFMSKFGFYICARKMSIFCSEIQFLPSDFLCWKVNDDNSDQSNLTKCDDLIRPAGKNEFIKKLSFFGKMSEINLA